MTVQLTEKKKKKGETLVAANNTYARYIICQAIARYNFFFLNFFGAATIHVAEETRGCVEGVFPDDQRTKN